MKIFEIHRQGKNTGNGPFNTKEEAASHIQRLREFALFKIKAGSVKYKDVLVDLELLDIVEVTC
jgi:hypothetical protein